MKLRVRWPLLAVQNAALAGPYTSVRVEGQVIPIGLWRRYLLVLAAATLSCTVTLKIAEIQYLELIFAADFLALCVALTSSRLRLRLFRPFFELARGYALFMVSAFLLSLLALGQQFNFALHASLLKQPVVVTLARIAELSLDIFYMLYLAVLYREDEALCRFGTRAYFWTGIAGCLYSFLTWPLNKLFQMQLGTYLNTARFRGFDNEGGPFGVYLISVIVLAGVLQRRNWISTLQFRWGLAILFVGLLNSQSKSAFLAVAMVGAVVTLSFLRGWKRGFALAGLGLSLFAVGSLVNLQQQVEQYQIGARLYQQLSNFRSTDSNFVMGRIAGAVLAPRMIAARPLTGIGWGNYPIVRDDPHYRQGTAFELIAIDAPGLGIVDYIVELGIPLWLFLTWLELKPVFMLRRVHADPWLLALAFVQPVSNWAGAHLNLIHPWMVVAFALGLGFHVPSPRVSLPESPG